ncbi:MAG: Arabinose 5-phosphate isomerase KdsD [Phycisphaerae bacterium]|nr:Arabinose 5-phosphate isomerase KdsD [Phycisphaerae bacterium]
MSQTKAGKAVEASSIAPDLDLARQVIAAEADAVRDLAAHLGEPFARAAGLLFRCTGTVVTTGIGKAGLVAQKISATLASTGTPSHFLHPVEALHGDLGRLRKQDILLVLSLSGETEEIVRLVNLVRKLSAGLISITATDGSTLAAHSDAVLTIGEVPEACPLGLAPTASTTAMLALGDALAMVVLQMRDFTPERFAEFHPGGSLGRQLMRVEEAMTFRRDRNLPLCEQTLTVREVIARASKIPRRPGAVLLTGADGKLSGIFTDADLRRLLNEKNLAMLDQPIEQVMTRNPRRMRAGELASAALAVFNELRIDELPVVDAADRPIGLIDVQDMVHLKLL